METTDNRNPIEITIPWIALAAVIALAALLRFTNLEALGYANHYYAAAVKSMLQSAHNFFFVAAEPGGSVSVDKPPVGLWLQAVSAYFLGVNGLALLLPQLLAGMMSVVVVYHLVRRTFGATAGLLAALGLAITPVVVATDRNNTIDSTLILALLLAAWAFIKATETGKLRHLLLGAFLVGVGFNIKMLQAALPLPAFYTLYILGSPERLWRKAGKLVLASLLLVVVSLSWAVVVDLTPTDQRPYVGSSGNNSETNLILGYNGLNRLLGMIGRRGNPPPGGGPQAGGIPPGRPPGENLGAPGTGQSSPGQPNPGQPNPGQPNPGQNNVLPPGRTTGNYAGIPPGMPVGSGSNFPPVGTGYVFPPGMQGGNPGSPPSPGGPGIGRNPFPSGAPARAPGGGFGGTGQPGALRLFTSPLSKEASWMLPFGLFSMFLLALRARLRWPVTPRHQAVILWGGWLLVSSVFFSVAGFFHEYYLSMLAPPLAALVGIGVNQLWRLHRVHSWWAISLLLVSAGVTLGFQVMTAQAFVDKVKWLPLVLAFFIIGSVLLISTAIHRQPRRVITRIGYIYIIASILITPGIWSALTTLNSSDNQSLPAAYGGRPSGPANRGDLQVNQALLDYLEVNTQDVTYLMAVPSSMQGSDYVLATGRPVLYMGGFMGQDQVVTAEDLSEMVRQGELRYIYWDAREGGFGNQSEVSSWVSTACQVVPGFDTATRNSGAPGGTLPGQPGAMYRQIRPFQQVGNMQIALYDCRP